MKQKLLNLCIWLGIMLFFITFIPSAHANEASPVRMKLIYGYDDMSFVETNDRVYLSAYDEIIFDDTLMYYIGPKIYQLDSLYETFIVEDIDTGDILYRKDGSDSIIFDAYNYINDVPISFTSNGETVVIDDFTNFMMYFVKEQEFSKPSEDLTLVVDVNQPVDIHELNSLFGAWDNYDGNITDSITIITDNYSENKNKTGFYTVTIEATDSSNNKTSFTYTVWVLDDEAPVVEPLDDINISYTETLDIDSLLENVVATDNYTTDLTISINEENYLGNEAIVGTYYVEIMVDDHNGNAITVVQVINVIDDVAPVISGNFYRILDVENFIRPNDIISPMTAIDEIDKDPIKVYMISFDYVKHTVGTFTAVIGATDKYGNEATATVTLVVSDSTSPEFFIKIPQINIVQNQVYDVEELLGMIESLLTINYTDIEIVQNDYTGNEAQPGVYVVTLSATTGTEKIRIQTQVRVHETPPVQTENAQIKSSDYWLLIGISLTTIVTIIGATLLIIYKKRKSIRLK